MRSFDPKSVIGKRIAGFDHRAYRVANNSVNPSGPKTTMHDPIFTLDDGSTIEFVVEEHPDGAGYGVRAVLRRPRKKTSAEVDRGRWWPR